METAIFISMEAALSFMSRYAETNPLSHVRVYPTHSRGERLGFKASYSLGSTWNDVTEVLVERHTHLNTD